MKNNYVLKLLEDLANKYSGDRKTKVAAGCYINGILEFGVNHLEYTLDEYEIVNRTALFYSTMIHAEADLCGRLGNSLAGKTVYVTLFPCDDCASKLIACGVKHLVVKEDRPNAPYVVKAKELLDMHSITYSIIG